MALVEYERPTKVAQLATFVETQTKADKAIVVRTKFIANPYTTTVTSKFYSRYRDHCDTCTSEAPHPKFSGDDPLDLKEPMEKFGDYEELVRRTLTAGPQSKYGGRQPLTSHDYGWHEADMFTKHHDEFDQRLMDVRMKKHIKSW